MPSPPCLGEGKGHFHEKIPSTKESGRNRQGRCRYNTEKKVRVRQKADRRNFRAKDFCRVFIGKKEDAEEGFSQNLF